MAFQVLPGLVAEVIRRQGDEEFSPQGYVTRPAHRDHSRNLDAVWGCCIW